MIFSGGSIIDGQAPSAGRDVPIWMSHVICNGNETSIHLCDHQGYGIHRCYHMEDVWLRCTNQTTIKPVTSVQTTILTTQGRYTF